MKMKLSIYGMSVLLLLSLPWKIAHAANGEASAAAHDNPAIEPPTQPDVPELEVRANKYSFVDFGYQNIQYNDFDEAAHGL